MCLSRAYLRASTKDQHADRARADLERFAKDRGFSIAAYYFENESGATLKRPELKRLLHDAHPGDVLLIEQVDRLSRLNGADWQTLQSELKAKHVRVVALDLPTSWQVIKASDDFSQRMAEAINGMMLEMLAAIARKDYEDRRRRQAQDVRAPNAKADGRYKGRPEDMARNALIVSALKGSKATARSSQAWVVRVRRWQSWRSDYRRERSAKRRAITIPVPLIAFRDPSELTSPSSAAGTMSRVVMSSITAGRTDAAAKVTSLKRSGSMTTSFSLRDFATKKISALSISALAITGSGGGENRPPPAKKAAQSGSVVHGRPQTRPRSQPR